MNNPEPQIHWLSVGQFAFSVLAIFGLWSAALGLAITGLAERFGSGILVTEPLPFLLISAGAVVSGILLLPSAGYSLLRLSGRPAHLPLPPLSSLRPTLLLLALPVVLLLGHWVAGNAALAWLLLPPLHVLAIGLPVLWLLYLGQRRLPNGSAQRKWGIFGSGLVLGPALIMVAELIALVVFVLIALVAISSQPDMYNQLQSLLQQLERGRTTPDMATKLLEPYLTQPVVMFAIFTFASVIVPLIEELFKPIGVWLLAGFDLTPAAGFAGGVLSGAGYALFESLALSSSGQDWTYLVVARIGTGVIHILTAGLTGWALALAWKEGRYLRLAATYLTAVLIHGTWNGLTLLSSVPTLLEMRGGQAWYPLVIRLGTLAPAGLAVLTAGAFVLLLWGNHELRGMHPEVEVT